jgi:hypothetical protein
MKRRQSALIYSWVDLYHTCENPHSLSSFSGRLKLPFTVKGTVAHYALRIVTEGTLLVTDFIYVIENELIAKPVDPA